MTRNTTRWPFQDRNRTVKKIENIFETTGVWPPESGSIWAAKPRPDEVAIFSPAKRADENQIVKINPAPMPIANSVRITRNPVIASKLCQLGTVTFDTTATPSKTAIIIRGCNGTDVPPKNGDAIKKLPTRKLAKNTVASDSKTNCRFKPGKAPTPPRFESVMASISLYALCAT